MFRQPQEGRLQDLLPVAPNNLRHRSRLDALRLQEPLEQRGFQDAQPDVQPDADQDDAEVEGNPPAPAGKPLRAGDVAHDQERPVRQEQANRNAELRPAGDQAALAPMAPFHREKDGSSPLAANADPLDKAEDDQEDGAPDADGGVGRHETNQEGCDSHQQQRRNQGRLPPDAIAVVPEDGSADRACDEPDRVN